MQSNKHVQTQFVNINLLSDPGFQAFLSAQQRYGIAQRGGAKLPFLDKGQLERISNDVNILDSRGLNDIIFESFISKN